METLSSYLYIKKVFLYIGFFLLVVADYGISILPVGIVVILHESEILAYSFKLLWLRKHARATESHSIYIQAMTSYKGIDVFLGDISYKTNNDGNFYIGTWIGQHMWDT